MAYRFNGREIIVDNFAGGGGASTGIELAVGRSVDIAINHDPAAIAMHRANHPDTEHYCENVWDVDPVKATRGRPIGLAWFSPDCTHFSKAKGGKPVSKKIRGLAWIILRWAALVKPRTFMMENVEEFQQWGPIDEDGQPVKERRSETFQAFKAALTTGLEPDHPAMEEIRDVLGDDFPYELLQEGLGYQVEFRALRACDYGAPTIRKRLFGIGRRDGLPIVWPEPTHGDPQSLEVKAGKLKPWRTAAEIIDWSLPCPSIFERKKPLAENTMRRIARGIQKFVINNPRPFVIKVNHAGHDFRGQEIDQPMQTITAKNGWGMVTPFIARIGQTGFGGDRLQYEMEQPLTTITTKAEHLLVAPTLMVNTTGHPGSQLTEPVRTITTGGHHGLVAAFLTKYHGETTGTEARGQKMTDPLYTLDTSNRFSLVTAAFMAKHYGGGYTGPGNGADEPLSTITTTDHNALVTSHMIKMRGTNIGHRTDEPLHTITAGGLHIGEVRAFLIKYYGTEVGQALDVPLHTVVAKDKFGLVTIHGEEYQIVDIGMRMLEPHELFQAQGFPPDYIIDTDANGNKYPKSAQVARCGNSVPPPFAEHLVRANLPELCAVPVGYTSATNLKIGQASLAI